MSLESGRNVFAQPLMLRTAVKHPGHAQGQRVPSPLFGARQESGLDSRNKLEKYKRMKVSDVITVPIGRICVQNILEGL